MLQGKIASFQYTENNRPREKEDKKHKRFFFHKLLNITDKDVKTAICILVRQERVNLLYSLTKKLFLTDNA